MNPRRRDFFISYTGIDRPWAEWVAWILEEKDYTVMIQAWDFRPGGNFVLDMDRAVGSCDRTLIILSQDYLDAKYTHPEWAAAFRQDPRSLERRLIPVRVGECKPEGLLAPIVYVDLIGQSRDEARQRLLNALKDRAKPEGEPFFPGDKSPEPLPVFAERAKPQTPPLFPGDMTVAAASEPNGNPFVPLVGGVEDPQRFFNCKKPIDRVFELLNANSSVALIGETGIGKSSILWAVKRLAAARLDSPRRPVLLNLATVYSEDDFYEDLCEALDMPVQEANSVVRSLRKQRLLLLLDEAERISQKNFPRRVREQLRGLAEGGDAPLRIVMTARTSLDRLFADSEVEGMTSPLEGVCVEETLSPWSQDEARQFIAARLGEGAVQFSLVELDQLLRESHGNPKQLMYACHQLYQRYREALQ